MLDNKKVGFIGGGMMAEAIARGLVKAGVASENIIISDPVQARREHLDSALGIKAVEENKEVRDFADVIILAVKPAIAHDAIADIADDMPVGKLIISIVAGVTTDSILTQLSGEIPVVRAMPNSPCLIGEGAIAVAPGKYATRDHVGIACEIFSATGLVVTVTEDKMDVVTGLSGSGPAYVYAFIEALADGGLRMGLPKLTAILLAAQTVAGSARMVLETKEHLSQLRDHVMTPGGTTVEGMYILESSGFKGAVMEAVKAATDKATALGKPKSG